MASADTLHSRPSPSADSASPPPATATLLPDSPAPPCPDPALARGCSVTTAIESGLLGPRADVFSDVVLVARDGVRVPAVRALLAVRSSYFRARLYTSYEDRKHATLSVPFGSVAVREVLRFAYTDQSRLVCDAQDAAQDASIAGPAGYHLLAKRKRPAATGCCDEDALPMQPEDICHLMELITAADYFDIPQLAERAGKAAAALVREAPELTCLMLEAVRRFPAVDIAAPDVLITAKDLLRREPDKCLLVNDCRTFARAVKRARSSDSSSGEVHSVHAGVLVLGDKCLREVLEDLELYASETYLFQVLYHWATEGRCLQFLHSGGVDAAEKPSNPRWSQAKNLIECINLGRVKASFIEDCVVPSGLVERHEIFAAYRQIALQAERRDLLHNKFRALARWDNKSRTITGPSKREYRAFVLDTPWITKGVHEWVFRLDKENGCSFIGFTSVLPMEDFFGNATTGWAYGLNGLCTHASKLCKTSGPRVEPGNTFKVVLNLAKSGTMSVLVGGAKKTFVAFIGMKKETSQFVPTVYLKKPASITLLDERHSTGHG